MPRQTKAQYYTTHQHLRRIWRSRDDFFGRLSPAEQWQLHDYFLPSMDWSKDQLLQHRADITKQRPSLPHQAGRAYAKLLRIVAQSRARADKPVPVAAGSSGGRRQLKVTALGVAKPVPDLAKLKRALIEMAKYQAAKREDDSAG